jgi:hypothetical protein
MASMAKRNLIVECMKPGEVYSSADLFEMVNEKRRTWFYHINQVAILASIDKRIEYIKTLSKENGQRRLALWRLKEGGVE